MTFSFIYQFIFYLLYFSPHFFNLLKSTYINSFIFTFPNRHIFIFPLYHIITLPVLEFNLHQRYMATFSSKRRWLLEATAAVGKGHLAVLVNAVLCVSHQNPNVYTLDCNVECGQSNHTHPRITQHSKQSQQRVVSMDKQQNFLVLSGF